MTTVEEPATCDVGNAHRTELAASRIDDDHIRARGYQTLHGTDEDRRRLVDLKIPAWARQDDTAFPGLLIPMYRVTGEQIGFQWKPAVPQEAPGDKNKKMKYASQKGGTSQLDVPPLASPRVKDPTNRLWVTEGIKKADCLASQDRAVIAITGVYNWRGKHGTLGDWEDIPLRGRQVVVCFDSDARTNRGVMSAMRRFGKWLESKGATPLYLIVPTGVNGVAVKGVDDFFAAGGTLDGLKDAVARELPAEGAKDAAFSDAMLADTVCDDELDGRFLWAQGLGWMEWNGKVWKESSDVSVTEAVRVWALAGFQRTLEQQKREPNRDLRNAIDGWRGVLSASKLANLVKLSRGIVGAHAVDFDDEPDLLNCQNGVVDLRTGELGEHDPNLRFTRIAGADYVKGARHADFDKALEALPEAVRPWYQVRIGQAATGHMTPDDRVVICQGAGENGKTTTTEAFADALGDYHVQISDRVLMGNASENHPTELMDLKGARYAVLEETPEAKRLDVHRVKSTVGTPRIKARKMRQDSVSFNATHSLFINTNPKPIVDETDRGIWRRLIMVCWPYTYCKTPAEAKGDNDRVGDPTLRSRIKMNPRVREAALAWIVEGARKWYDLGRVFPPDPESVTADTLDWRKEADLVLAYVSDYLVFDRDAYVLSKDLLADFNTFLKDKGHREWADKTFVMRFGGHDTVSRAAVEKARIRPRDGLSRPPGAAGALGKLNHVWMGLRFATPDEGGNGPQTDPFDPLGGPSGGSGPTPQGGPSNTPQGPFPVPDGAPCSNGSGPSEGSGDTVLVTDSSSDRVTSQKQKTLVEGGHQDHVPGVPSDPVNENFVSRIGVTDADGTPGTETMSFRSSTDPESSIPAPRHPETGAPHDGLFDFPAPSGHPSGEGVTEIPRTPVGGSSEATTDPSPAPQSPSGDVSGASPDDDPSRPVHDGALNPQTAVSAPVGFDIESPSADRLFTHQGSPYARLNGLIDEDGNEVRTTDVEALKTALDAAPVIYGHNVTKFDLMAVAWHHGTPEDYDRWAAKAWDSLVDEKVTDPSGGKHLKPWNVTGYYGLDKALERRGEPGKTDHLPALATEYGKKAGFKGKAAKDEGFALIPTDDPRYNAYLSGDLKATRRLYVAQQSAPERMDYRRREQRVAYIKNRMTLSGFKIDTSLLKERVREEAEKKDRALEWLHDTYGIPLGKEVARGRGKSKTTVFEPSLSPLSTTEGKAALIRAIQDITGQQHYPKTATGGLATSKEAMGTSVYRVGKGRDSQNRPALLNPQVIGRFRSGCETRLREFAEKVTMVTTTVLKYQEIASLLIGDRVHPLIGEDQGTGRWAMVKPSATNIGKRGGKVTQRAPFIADDGCVLICFDLDQADMRGVAGHCGDPAYLKMFFPHPETGERQDPHSMITNAVFGGRCSCPDLSHHVCEWRDKSKACGHGWNYGMSINGLVKNQGVERDVAETFDQRMRAQYPGLCEWQEDVRSRGERDELLDNGFGRLLRVDPHRAYTQAPAVVGQGTTRDIMCEGLLRLPHEYIPWLRAVVHDEIVLSVPEDRVEECVATVTDALSFDLAEVTQGRLHSVPILTGASRPARDWASCYAKD